MAEDSGVQAQAIAANAKAEVPAPGVAVWNWFSLDQAAAAALFSRKCGELEGHPPTPSADDLARGMTWSEATYREHRSLAVASILASVAFLEASVNELFASASHDNLELAGGQGQLTAPQRVVLTAAAEMIEGNRLLDRFQLALLLLGHGTFEPGRQPYQDAQLLVHLRNELVHYKPQFRAGAGAPTSEGWLRGLESKLTSTNPFTGTGNPFFPDRCLGHGCTVWAWNAALRFCDSFFRQIRVKPVHDLIRSQLIP
jgi:hypothetical protein